MRGAQSPLVHPPRSMTLCHNDFVVIHIMRSIRFGTPSRNVSDKVAKGDLGNQLTN